MRRFYHPLKWLFLFGIVAGCGALYSSQAGAVTIDRGSPDDWREFSSPEGGFSAEFPGTPAQKVSQVSTGSGKVPEHSFVLELKDRSYQIGYFDFPDSSED